MKKVLVDFIVILILILVIMFMYSHDLKNVRGGKAPTFCFSTEAIPEGGTIAYTGLGYKIIVYQSVEGWYEGVESGTIFLKYNVLKVNQWLRDPKKMLGVIEKVAIDLDGVYTLTIKSNIPYSYYDEVDVTLPGSVITLKDNKRIELNQLKVGDGVQVDFETVDFFGKRVTAVAGAISII